MRFANIENSNYIIGNHEETFFMGLLLSAQTTFAQMKANINPGNYYNYYSKSSSNLKGSTLKTDWLRLDDAVPVILEEFRKAGYGWLYDRTIFIN